MERTITEIDLRLQVNGRAYTLRVDPRATLVDTIREQLGMWGTKKGCDRGECGACTVHVGGRRILSCMTLAVLHDGDEITTIEGIARNGTLHTVQQAFIDHDALQCGYCTSGQIMSAVALLDEARARGITLEEDEIREKMSGNLCRCSCYPNIVAAVRAATGG